MHKRQPGKDYDKSEICVKYVRIFRQITMISREGLEIDLPGKKNTAEPHSMSTTEFGLTAQIPSMEYDFEKAAK